MTLNTIFICCMQIVDGTIADEGVGFALFTAAVCLYAGYHIYHQPKTGIY